MDTKKQVYFKRGQYLFGRYDFSDEQVDENNLIPVDDYVYAFLCDAPEPGLLFVERDRKKGVLTFYIGGYGGYGGMLHESNIFPFIYDEILLNGSDVGNCIGYAAVRIKHNWGILRLEDHVLDKSKRARRPCMMIVPCVYPTKQAAIAKITGSDYNPRYGWRDPFKSDDHTML